jgi:hypothetical protein
MRQSWTKITSSPRSISIGLGLHSINDIEEETKALHTDMMSLGAELSAQLFLQDDAHRAFDIPKPDTPEDMLSMYSKVWRPLMNEWLSFHDAHHDSFWQNLPLSGAWDRIQDFRQRMIGVRDQAKKQRFKIDSPDPIAPKRDPDFTKTIEDAARVAAYVAIAIGGIFALKALSGGGK